jgi:cytochrome c peroxidase
MHAGQLPTLAHVLLHYNTAPPAPAGHSEVQPLRLTPMELRQLEAFLRALSGGTAASPMFLAAPAGMK